ncbi:MAG: heparinase II/III family protein, partial [Phycisphaerae bacterium]|nr:heparinase II/III family protein [Phycisphaerae bacterium]
YPKFRAEFDTWIDFVVAGRFGPCYGDDGGGRTRRFPKGIPADLRTAYERAYRRWPTDKLARAIYRLGKRDPGLFEEDIWPQIEAQAKKAGPEPPLESRVMDGVGFVFLESRPHAKDPRDRAGIALRYGYGGGHAHHDNLNIEMFAKGLSVSPELGYPTWAHPMGNTGHVAHHNTGMIDRSPQYEHKGGTLSIARGELELFSGAPEASFAQISARPNGFPNSIYRRAVCLADAPGDNVYLVDILRMAGGTVRTCCFHGPGDDMRSNLKFEKKMRAPEAGKAGHMYVNNIVEPQIAVSDDDAWGDWKCQGKGVRLRLLYMGKPGRRYITARCAKPDIPPIRYLFAEEERKDGASEFISIWQPYEGKPFIEKVELLPVQGEAKQGVFRPVAIRVVLAGGQVDTFIYSHDPNAELRVGDLEFKGSFGYWSELKGKPRALHLVNGGRLRKGKHGVSDAPPSFRAQITRVDLLNRFLTLDRKLPEDKDWKGRLLFIRGGTHRTAYHIVKVLPPGNVVKFDLNSIIFRSRIMSVAKNRTYLVTEISPPIEAARGFKPGYYNGAVLTGEDLKARYRVSKVEDDKIYTDRPVSEADFPDIDGDGRRMVSMVDFGAGDEVTVYRSVYNEHKYIRSQER